jgi:nucleotide-binding universal stress UspA family protein
MGAVRRRREAGAPRGGAAGVKSLQWRAPAGDPLEAAVLQARYSDLAVIGQPVHKGPDAAFSAGLANAVVMDSGRPVLMIPYIGAAKTLGERILIAWKDSRESARAVADALPLLKDAKAVCHRGLATATSQCRVRVRQGGRGFAPPRRMRPSTDGAPSHPASSRTARRTSAQTIVMGSYAAAPVHFVGRRVEPDARIMICRVLMSH